MQTAQIATTPFSNTIHPQMSDPIRDPKRMNNFARTHLGFFFTSSADCPLEAQILETATVTICTALRESKIRSGNVHEHVPVADRPTSTTVTNWSQLGIFIENLGKSVQAHAQRLGLESLSDLDAAFAWSSALVFANMGARNEMIERIKDRERANVADADGFVKVRK